MSVEHTEEILEEIYQRNRPAVLENIEQKQSAIAKKRKADEEAQGSTAASSRQVEAPSQSVRPFLEPETASTRRPFPEPDSSHSKGSYQLSSRWSSRIVKLRLVMELQPKSLQLAAWMD